MIMQIVLGRACELNIFTKPVLSEMRFLIQENKPEKQINLVDKLSHQTYALENAANTLVNSQPMATFFS